MLKYALIFAVISLIAGALGFGGVAAVVLHRPGMAPARPALPRSCLACS